MMKPTGLLSLAACAALAPAQFLSGAARNGSISLLCDKTFDDANGTGFYSLGPHGFQDLQNGIFSSGRPTPPVPSWAVTLFANYLDPNATLELATWYNTNGANYSNNTALGYDACVVPVFTPSNDALLRAAEDTGDCMTMFDEPCVNALRSQSAQIADDLVNELNADPSFNATTERYLTGVCENLGVRLTSNFPAECVGFFNGTAQVFGTDMTSRNESWLDTSCGISDAETGPVYRYATGLHMSTLGYTPEQRDAAYNTYGRTVFPTLNVFMPLAGANTGSTIQTASSSLICGLVTDINAESLQLSALEGDTSGDEGASLSGGAIAGIVVGVLALVVCILGVWWYCRRRSKTASRSGPAELEQQDAHNRGSTFGSELHAHPALPRELSALETEMKFELDGKDGARMELPAGGEKSELPGGQEKLAELPAP